jgi:cobalt-zinc-cadmium resistance protein CzcA
VVEARRDLMLARLVAFSLSQRLLVLLAGAALLIAGGLAYRSLPVDAFPDVSPTQVKLVMKAPGMTPEEVESRVVAPLEQELLGIPQQSVLRSIAKYGLADVTVDFREGVDVYWARQQVAERLAGVMADLPPGIGGGVAPLTTPLGDVYMFTLEGPLSLAEKRTLIDWTIRPRLRSVPGVADLNALGGHVRTLEVAPDPQALAARGINLGQLESALINNSRGDGAGRVTAGEESLPVRIDASVRTPAEVAAIGVAASGDSVVRVGDVARVGEGSLTRYGAVTRNGTGEAAEGLVLALRGANARDVVTRAKAALADIGRILPAGVSVQGFYDRGVLVDHAVGSVSEALLEATVIVVILLLLFLGEVRAALVVALLLPLSVLGTFLVMKSIGLSANLMSLSGLAIAIGMLVDAGVVVTENVLARMAHPAPGIQPPRLHQIYRAVIEVASPVAGGVLIIAVVFLPLLTLEGLEGKLFRPVAITIVIALSISLLLSLTVVPALASLLLRPHGDQEPWLMRRIQSGFEPLFRRLLQRDRAVLIGAAIAVTAAVVAAPFIGRSFLPTMDEGDIIMQLQKLPSISLEQTLRIDQAFERRILAEVPEVRAVIARSGSDELGLDPMGLNETDMFLQLKPRSEWRGDKQRIIEDLRRIGADVPGVDVSFTQPIEMRVAEMLTGTRGDVAVKVFGPDLVELNRIAQGIRKTLQSVPGSEDVLYAANDGVQYLRVGLDRTVVGRLGISATDVQRQLRSLVEGQRVGVVDVEGRRVPLVLRGTEEFRQDPSRLAAIAIAGTRVAPLGAVAALDTVEGPVRIMHENASRFAVVQSNVRGRDLVGFVAEAQQKVAASVPLPGGYRLEWGGQFENQQRATARLALVVPVSLLLVVLLLFGTLGSLRQAFLVFANIPFALIGGILALAVTREYLSVPAAVGFIALMGIAVLNGLVLVTHFNELIARGVPIESAVERGVLRRLRPVLMTASITALGLVPMLLASGPGSEIQRPLAIVVIGGLVSSTALTLIVLPILFRRFGMVRS